MSSVPDLLRHLGGVPVGSPVFHTGKAIFVRPYSGSDTAQGKKPTSAVKTLARALEIADADSGDCVYMIAESNTASLTSDYQSATLDWNKDGVHLIGVGSTPLIGQRARIGQLSTATVATPLVTLSADNCIVSNIEIFHGAGGANPTAASYAMSVTGQRNHVNNCQISGIGHSDLDDAGSRSLLISAGSENLFSHCYIGLDTVIRATATAEIEITGAATRNVFEDCMINTYTSSASFVFVDIAAAMDRFTAFRRCLFNAAENITSATVLTAGMSVAAVNGKVLIDDCMFSGCTDITASDNSRVKILSRTGAADASGEHKEMGLAKSIDVA